MRNAVKIVAVVLLLAALLMIVVTRLGVKNKNATLIYGGKKSPSVRLFHGAGKPLGYDLLIYLPEPGEDQPYVVAYNHLLVCEPRDFRTLKLIALGKQKNCRTLVSNSIFIKNQAVEFVSKKGVAVVVYWQTPPR